MKERLPIASFADIRSGLLLLNLLVWVRQQPWLQRVYRAFPQWLRDRVAGVLSSRFIARTKFPRTEAWSRASIRGEQPVFMPSRAKEGAACGVNIFGYIRGQFGLAESVRMYARALIGAGVPVALHDVDLGLRHGWNDHSMDAYINDDAPYPVSIIFVNPDYLAPALKQIGRARLENRYLIGCWFWELELIPDSWLEAIDQVDEIMVASRFVEEAFRRVTDKPILRVPLPLSPVPDSGLQRGDFGLEPDHFIFLCTFDFNSYVARKNPYAVIRAFRAAFPLERNDVRLLVKSSNGHWHSDGLRQLLNAVAGDPRIIIRDEVIDRAHVHALQRCCDVYVSLHRAEGFGLGLAECMAMGKPVIATGWSGNLQFMSDTNSCLVNFSLVQVENNEYPESHDARWANADISSAAAAMRKLADDPGQARVLGERAKHDVSVELSPERAAGLLIARVSEIHAAMSRNRSFAE